MKNFFTGGRQEKTQKEVAGFSGRGEQKSPFTSDFFKFLIGFAVIITASFLILTFAGNG